MKNYILIGSSIIISIILIILMLLSKFMNNSLNLVV